MRMGIVMMFVILIVANKRYTCRCIDYGMSIYERFIKKGF